jgi:cytochrome c-type biogenesis protein CcmH
MFSVNLNAGPIDALEFKDPAKEKRYFNLIEELRCLKCQNSNIAGSNAALAQDLRRKVYDMIVNKNMSDDEIKDWMLARYGDFVLYKPPVKPGTYLLWGLPAILGIIGLIILIVRLKSSKIEPELKISPEQQKQIEEALK